MIDKNYILSAGKVTGDINLLINENIQNGFMIVMYTEKFECTSQQTIDDVSHLIEVRIFNENRELKIMRPTISDGFTYRLIDDTAGKYEYIEEEQYMDIDETKSSGTNYTATGGGKYTLPIENAERLLIRNYISYDEQGIAQITDFRAVKFLKEVNACERR